MEWTATSPTNYVPIGTNVYFRAVPCPEGVAWPNGKPVWKGVTPSSVSEAKTIFTAPGFYDVTAECGNVVTAKMCAVKIETKTFAIFPVDRTRKMLGVGERVQVSITPSNIPGKWQASAGVLSVNASSTIIYTAPHTKQTVAVSFLVESGITSFGTDFEVVEPALGYIKALAPALYYETNMAGAGMVLDVAISPINVSFSKVEVMEVGAKATNVSGYFKNNTNIPPAVFIHGKDNGADKWIEIYDCNDLGEDIVDIIHLPEPWEAGEFAMPVPARWRVIGSEGTNTLLWSDMKFSIDADGATTVEKFNHGVKRSVDDVIVNVF